MHAERIFDLAEGKPAPIDGPSSPGQGSAAADRPLAGRGQVTHVYVERAIKASRPWPQALLSRIWSGAPLAPPGPLPPHAPRPRPAPEPCRSF